MGIPILGDIINAVKDVVSEVVVDVDKKKEIELELARLENEAEVRLHEEVIAQIEVNKIEAASGSLFVAGWRPAVGWICAAALGAQSILLPLVDRIFGWSMPFDTELLILTLGGMLGIGGMRSFEKVKGVSTNDFTDIPRGPSKPLIVIDEAPLPEVVTATPKKKRFKI